MNYKKATTDFENEVLIYPSGSIRPGIITHNTLKSNFGDAEVRMVTSVWQC